jgi:hypothetical protein
LLEPPGELRIRQLFFKVAIKIRLLHNGALSGHCLIELYREPACSCNINIDVF